MAEQDVVSGVGRLVVRTRFDTGARSRMRVHGLSPEDAEDPAWSVFEVAAALHGLDRLMAMSLDIAYTERSEWAQSSHGYEVPVMFNHDEMTVLRLRLESPLELVVAIPAVFATARLLGPMIDLIKRLHNIDVEIESDRVRMEADLAEDLLREREAHARLIDLGAHQLIRESRGDAALVEVSFDVEPEDYE